METVVRGIAMYAFLLIATRLSGRRTLAQTTPFDFVLLLIIAETTQQALLGEDDYSITNAVILIVTLFATDVLLSFATRKASAIALLVDGTPTVLISNGRIDAEAMRRARIEPAEVLEAARVRLGLERMNQIRHAVMESSGEISIIPFRFNDAPRQGRLDPAGVAGPDAASGSS